MAARTEDASPMSGVQAFAAELKAQREATGLTQEQLAGRMGYSPSVIAKLETCRTYPSKQHADQADQALGTPGTFRRLRKCRYSSLPAWFHRWPEAAEQAQTLRWYEPLLIPGLLQSEGYARAVLRGAQPDATDERIDDQVSARMQRQEVLLKEDPPYLWCVWTKGSCIAVSVIARSCRSSSRT